MVRAAQKVRSVAFLKYPQPLTDVNLAKDVYCYVLPHPGTDGLAVLVVRTPDQDRVAVQLGDWHGAIVDITGASETAVQAKDFLNQNLPNILQLFKLAKIPQAQLYFALIPELTLVDVQISLNKFCGPGMLKDLFGRVLPTPAIRKIEVIDDRAIRAIADGRGSYKGDLLIKPSRFRMAEVKTNQYAPLYVEVLRNI